MEGGLKFHLAQDEEHKRQEFNNCVHAPPAHNPDPMTLKYQEMGQTKLYISQSYLRPI